ncbi:MAG TPA: helix-turn-helix transcriptional regulator [Anaerolineae bacterium]|nr:helix-turn-helix transcriptional regulator [Anaerolineae bacterium]
MSGPASTPSTLHTDAADPSPLAASISAAGLTLEEIAQKLACTVSAVSRYVSGQRTAPTFLYVLLGEANLRHQMEGWRRRHGRGGRKAPVQLIIETKLPKGCTEEEAKQACLAALATLRGRRP